MEVFKQRRRLLIIMGSLGFLASVVWWAGQESAIHFLTVSAVPLFGMALGRDGSMASDFEDITRLSGFPGAETRTPPSEALDPEWLLYAKGIFDGGMKAGLFIFHWALLTPALPFSDQYLGDVQGLGAFMDGIGLGDITLAALMGGILSIVAIMTPVGAWYLMLTSNTTFKSYWHSSAVNKVILGSVIGLYALLLLMEWSILFGRIADMTQPPGPLPLLVEQPNPGVMVVLSFLVSLVTFILGYLTAKLFISIERRQRL